MEEILKQLANISADNVAHNQHGEAGECLYFDIPWQIAIDAADMLLEGKRVAATSAMVPARWEVADGLATLFVGGKPYGRVQVNATKNDMGHICPLVQIPGRRDEETISLWWGCNELKDLARQQVEREAQRHVGRYPRLSIEWPDDPTQEEDNA